MMFKKATRRTPAILQHTAQLILELFCHATPAKLFSLLASWLYHPLALSIRRKDKTRDIMGNWSLVTHM